MVATRKDKSLDLNATIEKPITWLKNLTIDDKDIGKSRVDMLDAKCEQKKWQENKLQKLGVEKLKEKGLALVPKRSVQTQKDDAQTSRSKGKKKMQ